MFENHHGTLPSEVTDSIGPNTDNLCVTEARSSMGRMFFFSHLTGRNGQKGAGPSEGQLESSFVPPSICRKRCGELDRSQEHDIPYQWLFPHVIVPSSLSFKTVLIKHPAAFTVLVILIKTQLTRHSKIGAEWENV